jgi:DNA-binding transcriptional MerR regulator
MIEKSGIAYRSIGEVAEMLELPNHVLRFWETKFQQIRPLKSESGRRLYRPEDIQFIDNLKLLLYDRGYTIKGAQKFIADQGVDAIRSLGEAEEKPASAMPAEAKRSLDQAKDLLQQAKLVLARSAE